MLHLRRYCCRLALRQFVRYQLGLRNGIAEPSFSHGQATPHAFLRRMFRQQSSRYRRFGELRCFLVGGQVFGHFKAVTAQALQFRPEMFCSSLDTFNPGTINEWRIVPDMLDMMAIELRYPIIRFVAVKTRYRPFHLHCLPDIAPSCR